MNTTDNNVRKNTELSFLAVILFGLIACLLYGIGAGLRGNIGILLNPIAAHCHLAYSDVSICIAVMQLMFGGTQPFFGILASRKSNRFVIVLGTICLVAGLAGIALSHSFIPLMISLGLLFGTGTGAISFGIVLTSAIHFAGPKHAMTLSGMLNASAGMVGFILSPALQSLLSGYGLIATLNIMIGIVAMMVPVAMVVTSHDKKAELSSPAKKDPVSRVNSEDAGAEGDAEEKFGLEVFREAFRDPTYRMLFAGFSTCGFHMVIIESHLFSQFVLFGIDQKSASWAFSVYGLATILGALLSGYLSARIHKGRLLGFYYGFRAVWTLLYLFIMPKNVFTAVIFSIGLGMTGDATVSPTSGLVNENFRIEKVATLLGVLFFTHQVGAFASAWLGGIVRESMGSYTLIWMIDVCLCTFAAVMSLRIKAKKSTEEIAA